MHIYLGADHRGLSLKDQLVHWLENQNIEFTDFGAYELLPEDDYNDYAKKVITAILEANTQPSFGVLICGSAQGMCMQANRTPSIRAAICHNPDEAIETRTHNDANILCLAADRTDAASTTAILEAFIHTAPLTDPKYLRRNQKLDEEL